MAKTIAIALTILLVAGIFFWYGFFINDLQNNYVETGLTSPDAINQTYLDGFDKSSELNESIGKITDSFQSSFGDDGNWKIFQSIVALPSVIIALPGIMITIVGLAITSFMDITKLLGIPSEIIVIGGFVIGVFIAFKLVEMWRQYDA